jgi:signal transduction histidine kinase
MLSVRTSGQPDIETVVTVGSPAEEIGPRPAMVLALWLVTHCVDRRGGAILRLFGSSSIPIGVIGGHELVERCRTQTGSTKSSCERLTSTPGTRGCRPRDQGAKLNTAGGNVTQETLQISLPRNSLVPLESILCTGELSQRPSRLPDYEKENRALLLLVQALANSPRIILQTLADTILEVFQADSAGISLLSKEDGGKRFYWPAIAGVWKPHVGGGTPRDFGPCGDVLDRDAPLLFRHFERRYAYFLPVTPPVEECLLVPFYVDDKAVGTIWAIAHDERRKFDAEDLRQLQSLGRFASAAYQEVESLAASEQREEALRYSNAELERTQRALRDADRRKDIFIATVAHELRQPIAAMLPAVTLMRKPDSERSGTRAFAVIERQVTHLTRMIGDLLDVARVAEGKLDLQKERLDGRDAIRDAVASTAALFEAHGHRLSVSLPDQAVWLDADRTRLHQVFTNLLTNAAKYTEDGGQISLNAQTDDARATIRIIDNGKGIAPDALPHVFDLFMQEATEHREGLGIGLRVVRGLVELHGGRVAARSDGIGKGSEFVVTLPVDAATAAT